MTDSTDIGVMQAITSTPSIRCRAAKEIKNSCTCDSNSQENNSTQFCSECMISPVTKVQQLEQQIQWLQRELKEERKRRQEYFDDLIGKGIEIEEIGVINQNLLQQVEKLKRQIARLTEDGRNAAASLAVDDTAKEDFITEVRKRNAELVTEMKELKNRNKFLEKDNDMLYEQLNQLKSRLPSKVSEKGNESDSRPIVVSDLHDLLNTIEARLNCCMSTYEELKVENDQQREMYRQSIEELSRKHEDGGLSESGECLGNVLEPAAVQSAANSIAACEMVGAETQTEEMHSWSKNSVQLLEEQLQASEQMVTALKEKLQHLTLQLNLEQEKFKRSVEELAGHKAEDDLAAGLKLRLMATEKKNCNLQSIIKRLEAERKKKQVEIAGLEEWGNKLFDELFELKSKQ